MSIRKWLLKLNNRLEASWQHVELDQSPVVISAGWYVSEFTYDSSAEATPRIVIKEQSTKGQDGLDIERVLQGSHAGRNRMLFFLPQGQIIAHSQSIQFERLARISSIEARFRTLLICARYLVDFFSFKVLMKMVVLQFQRPFARSSNLLRFYSPDASSYLDNIDAWKKFEGFSRVLFMFSGKAKIAVVIERESQRAALEQMLLPPDWIILAEAAAEIPTAADYVIPLHSSETLRSPAILMLKNALKKAVKERTKAPLLVYTDHDYAGADDSPPLLPVFKPSPSLSYLACFNYIGPAIAFARDVVADSALPELMSETYCYTKALKCFNNTAEVLHVSEVLFQSARTQPPLTPEPVNLKPLESKPTVQPDAELTFGAHLNWQRREGYNVLVADTDIDNQGPAVDLIIPTRDGLSVLRPCVDGILSKTSYQNFHIIVVDNGSEKAETLAYFEQIKQDSRVKVVHYPGEFNYSAINNFAIEHGSSPYIGLINNDIEVIKGDWLSHMMAWAIQPQVGIVGAKLLFSDGRVQHAGVTIGMGNAAGHIHRLEAGDASGYQLRCLATQNMMAVTAACLITPRDTYYQLGRLDEGALKVAYNDIDYCLRVEQSGLQVIWTPEAVLYHHESVSRGDDMSAPHIDRYFNELKVLQSRWKTKGFVDKYYSRHLRISDEGVFPQLEGTQTDPLVYLTEQSAA